MTANDPTAQELPLTQGQQLVADYEMDQIAEPCELAEAIDKAIGAAYVKGLHDGSRQGDLGLEEAS